MPYERIIQWAAGPIAVIAGWLATQLVNHVNIFGSLGFSKDQVAKGLFDAVTFAVAALVTYAAHHKWLTNLPKWWDHSGLGAPSGLEPSGNAAIVPEYESNGHAPALGQQIATLQNELDQLRAGA